MADEALSAVAVTVLTGFLGSGKTTLLNHLLTAPDMGNTAVLINEFGDISIDHLLVESIDETTVLLEGGCVCCSVRGDLVEAMTALIAKRADGRVPPFGRLIMETTGLADPAPILHTLMAAPVIAGHYRLDGVITVVDGVLGEQTLQSQPQAVKQVALADRIVISKVDLNHDIEDLEHRIKSITHTATIIHAQHGRVAARAVLNAGLFDEHFQAHVERWLGNDKIKPHTHHAHHNHGANINTFVIETHGPLDFMVFQDWLETLLATQGENVLRMKGILDIKDVDRPVAVHGVQHIFHPPAALPNWDGLEKCSRLVFITQNLSAQAVRDMFKAYFSDHVVT